MIMIGLTGERGMGKTHVADVLVKHYGFTKMHAFAPGKAMSMTYFLYLGMDHETAFQCVYGNLKDTKHPLIPGDGLPRTFMEDLGKFMGKGLGPEFTLDVERKRLLRMDPNARIVIESVVYEATFFQSLGGKVVDVVRPQNKGGIVGIHTDEAVKNIVPDYRLDNSSDYIEILRMHIDTMLDDLSGWGDTK